MASPNQNFVYTAKLAEQAERYEGNIAFSLLIRIFLYFSFFFCLFV